MSCLHGPLPHLWNTPQTWFHTISTSSSSSKALQTSVLPCVFHKWHKGQPTMAWYSNTGIRVWLATPFSAIKKCWRGKKKVVSILLCFLANLLPRIIIRLLEMLTKLTGSEVTFAQRFLMLFVCPYMKQVLVCTKGSDKETWSCKCRPGK